MYPDQVEKIRRQQQGLTPLSDEILFRRTAAEIHVARRFRFRAVTPAERDRIESWVLYGGPRPWGM